MLRTLFLSVVLVILVVSDLLVWFRFLRTSGPQRLGQLIGAIGLLVAAIVVALLVAGVI